MLCSKKKFFLKLAAFALNDKLKCINVLKNLNIQIKITDNLTLQLIYK